MLNEEGLEQEEGSVAQEPEQVVAPVASEVQEPVTEAVAAPVAEEEKPKAKAKKVKAVEPVKEAEVDTDIELLNSLLLAASQTPAIYSQLSPLKKKKLFAYVSSLIK